MQETVEYIRRFPCGDTSNELYPRKPPSRSFVFSSSRCGAIEIAFDKVVWKAALDGRNLVQTRVLLGEIGHVQTLLKAEAHARLNAIQLNALHAAQLRILALDEKADRQAEADERLRHRLEVVLGSAVAAVEELGI